MEEEIFIGDVGAEKRRKMKIKFQVADVKKPLMAVRRIVENGNRVVFSEAGSFIINDKTGDNAINIVPGAAGTLSNKDIDNNIEFLKNSKIFLTQLETPYEVTSYALNKAKESGSVTIFNPAPASNINDSDFKCMDYFTPNETEASFYLGKKVESKI